MATQQDILRTMMTQLDEDSDKIPEGLYLKLCDHLKNLHTCQPTQVFLQRPSAPRRCGRCHQVGHNRRGCRYHEADHHALDSAYQNGQTPAEAGIERKPVYRINYPGGRAFVNGVSGCPWRSGRVVVEVDLPGVESVREITWNAFTRGGVHINVPGKYKIKILLTVNIDEVVSSIWNPRTQSLTYTLQTVDSPPLPSPFEDTDDEDEDWTGTTNSPSDPRTESGWRLYRKQMEQLVKSSNTLNP